MDRPRSLRRWKVSVRMWPGGVAPGAGAGAPPGTGAGIGTGPGTGTGTEP